MNINTKTYLAVNGKLLDILDDLEERIFAEPYSREKLERELSTRHNLIAIVAFAGDKACGFKVGFETTSTLFYSWIGGVVPEQRRKGIARELMQQQHALASRLGYTCVRTETENRFRNMLLLNIRFGFEVVGVRTSNQYPKTIITLEKCLRQDEN